MEASVTVTHPNRNTPESNSARFAVIALLAASIALMLCILLLGWSVLEGMALVSFGYVIVYGILVWRVSQWARGPLAVGAALAVILVILGIIAVPTWSDRNGGGYAAPEAIWGGAGLSSSMLGLATTLLVVVQLAVLIACIWAFRQEWQVELEVATGSLDDGSQPTPGREHLPRPGAA